jgi:hypothetical protein
LAPLEEAILRLAQVQPASAGQLHSASRGVPAVSGTVRTVLAWISDRMRAGTPPQTPEILRHLRAEIGEEIEASFLVDEDLPVPDEAYRDALLGRLRESALEAEMVGLGYEIRVRESSGRDSEEIPELLARKQQLARELARLRETRREAGG